MPKKHILTVTNEMVRNPACFADVTAKVMEAIDNKPQDYDLVVDYSGVPHTKYSATTFLLIMSARKLGFACLTLKGFPDKEPLLAKLNELPEGVKNTVKVL